MPSFAALATHMLWGEYSREHGRGLVVAPTGRLSRYDSASRQDPGILFRPSVSTVRPGWQLLVGSGDIAASGPGDLVAWDKDGVMRNPAQRQDIAVF